jgi:hypothetical protein
VRHTSNRLPPFFNLTIDTLVSLKIPPLGALLEGGGAADYSSLDLVRRLIDRHGADKMWIRIMVVLLISRSGNLYKFKFRNSVPSSMSR